MHPATLFTANSWFNPPDPQMGLDSVGLQAAWADSSLNLRQRQQLLEALCVFIAHPSHAEHQQEGLRLWQQWQGDFSKIDFLSSLHTLAYAVEVFGPQAALRPHAIHAMLDITQNKDFLGDKPDLGEYLPLAEALFAIIQSNSLADAELKDCRTILERLWCDAIVPSTEYGNHYNPRAAIRLIDLANNATTAAICHTIADALHKHNHAQELLSVKTALQGEKEYYEALSNWYRGTVPGMHHDLRRNPISLHPLAREILAQAKTHAPVTWAELIIASITSNTVFCDEQKTELANALIDITAAPELYKNGGEYADAFSTACALYIADDAIPHEIRINLAKNILMPSNLQKMGGVHLHDFCKMWIWASAQPELQEYTSDAVFRSIINNHVGLNAPADRWVMHANNLGWKPAHHKILQEKIIALGQNIIDTGHWDARTFADIAYQWMGVFALPPEQMPDYVDRRKVANSIIRESVYTSVFSRGHGLAILNLLLNVSGYLQLISDYPQPEKAYRATALYLEKFLRANDLAQLNKSALIEQAQKIPESIRTAYPTIMALLAAPAGAEIKPDPIVPTHCTDTLAENLTSDLSACTIKDIEKHMGEQKKAFYNCNSYQIPLPYSLREDAWLVKFAPLGQVHGYVAEYSDNMRYNPYGHFIQFDRLDSTNKRPLIPEQKGWKFHIQVDAVHEEAAYECLLPILARHTIREFKFLCEKPRYKEGKDGKPTTTKSNQHRKNITIYADEDGLTAAQWKGILQEIEDALYVLRVRCGGQIRNDRRVRGSQYSFYRCDRNNDGQYLAVDKVQGFNPNGAPDPFAEILIQSPYSRNHARTARIRARKLHR